MSCPNCSEEKLYHSKVGPCYNCGLGFSNPIKKVNMKEPKVVIKGIPIKNGLFFYHGKSIYIVDWDKGGIQYVLDVNKKIIITADVSKEDLKLFNFERERALCPA